MLFHDTVLQDRYVKHTVSLVGDHHAEISGGTYHISMIYSMLQNANVYNFRFQTMVVFCLVCLVNVHSLRTGKVHHFPAG